MKDNITIGDIVRLRSGGPNMLVVDILPGDELYCFWGKKDSIGVGCFKPVEVDVVLEETWVKSI